MVATEVVHASVHGQLNLMPKRTALETCEFYEVYQAPVEKAEGGVDAHTEQKTSSKSSRYGGKLMSLCKT
jgi:hypothetical protein